MPSFHVRFDQLDDSGVAALTAFFDGAQLRVKGLDGRDWGHYRGGCLPLLIVGAAFGALPVLLELDVAQWLVVTVCTAWMGWATSRFYRSWGANRRSRALSDKGPWHGIAWDGERLAFRSWTDCLLVSWDEVGEVRFLDDRWGIGLTDTLWIHMRDGRKVQLAQKDARFAGRTMEAWFIDLAEALTAATGRVSTRPSPVTK